MKFCPYCASKLTQKIVERRTYATCLSCQFTNWKNPTPVVAAIVEIDGRVILVHNKLWPEKMLGLVSGFLEEKEDPYIAVQREVKEELGLDTLSTKLVGAYGFEQQNQIIIAYHLICKGDIELGEELDAFKAIEPEKLKAWEFGTGPAIKDWLSNRQP